MVTIEKTAVLSGPFIGNGITTHFPRDFPIAGADHVVVQVDGTVISTGYTVLNPDDGTGDVVFDSAPAVDAVIYLTRETPIQQDTDYSAQGTVSPEQIESDLDRRTLVEQEIRRDLARAIKAPLGQTDMQIADMDEGQIVVSGPNNTLIAGGSIDLLANAQTHAQNAQTAHDGAQQALADANKALDSTEVARDQAQQAAQDAQNIVFAVPVGSDLDGMGGRILAVKQDESGYALVQSPSAFYGLNVTDGSLLFDRGTVNYGASDFVWSGIFPVGILLSINTDGHLVATAA